MDTGTSPRAVARGRRARGLVAAVACALASVAPGTVTASSVAGSDEAPPVTANEFIPEDRDLSECISAVPKPDCGSEARGGWRQGVVLALVVIGMLGIAARVAVAIRRRDRELTARAVADERARPVSRER